MNIPLFPTCNGCGRRHFQFLPTHPLLSDRGYCSEECKEGSEVREALKAPSYTSLDFEAHMNALCGRMANLFRKP